mmetsp:Transcript_7664/g.28715  ORF Transcript_7664/g.28715 Transcript_7664/m.28715 type:complete len:204 (+) Transcript_7664:520-1131(+)
MAPTQHQSTLRGAEHGEVVGRYYRCEASSRGARRGRRRNARDLATRAQVNVLVSVFCGDAFRDEVVSQRCFRGRLRCHLRFLQSFFQGKRQTRRLHLLARRIQNPRQRFRFQRVHLREFLEVAFFLSCLGFGFGSANRKIARFAAQHAPHETRCEGYWKGRLVRDGVPQQLAEYHKCGLDSHGKNLGEVERAVHRRFALRPRQ